MLHALLAYFFGITIITGPKLLYVGLALVNVGLMVWLSLRAPIWFKAYLEGAAASTLLFASPLWNQVSEVVLTLIAAGWVVSMLPKATGERVFALGIGLMVVSALVYAEPAAYGKFHPSPYFTRIYSAAGFLAVMVGVVVLAWVKHRPTGWQQIIAIPWFTATLLGGTQLGWDYFAVGVAAKLVWTACLVGWLLIPRPRHAH